MNDIRAKIGSLKQAAKAAREFNDFRAAIEKLDQAIELLQQEKQGIRALPEEERSAADSEINRQLADCYGMKGGVYRRAAMTASGAERDLQLKNAEEMYVQGMNFERDDSYNLTNSIVLGLLRKPAQLDELEQRAARARDIVEAQVKGPRATQWWAWADLGLLSLLVKDFDRAAYAYQQFGRTGAQARDYQSTINVLRDLDAASPDEATRRRFADAIALLERQKALVS
jgi:hypothetical protein